MLASTWHLIRRRLSRGETVMGLSRMLGIDPRTVRRVKQGVPAVQSFLDCLTCGHRNRQRDRHCRRCTKRLYSGMTTGMKRTGEDMAILLRSTLAGSTPIDFKPWSGGIIEIPAGSPITSLTFYTGRSAGEGTITIDPEEFSEFADIPAFAVEAKKSHELPPALFGAHALIIVADQEGAVTLYLKS